MAPSKIIRKSAAVKISKDELVKIACETIQITDVSQSNEYELLNSTSWKVINYTNEQKPQIIEQNAAVKLMLEQIKTKRDALKQLKLKVRAAKIYSSILLKQINNIKKVTLSPEEKKLKNQQLRQLAKERKQAKKQAELAKKLEEDQYLQDCITKANQERDEMAAELQRVKALLNQKQQAVSEFESEKEDNDSIKDESDIQSDIQSDNESNDEYVEQYEPVIQYFKQPKVEESINIEGKVYYVSKLKKDSKGQWKHSGQNVIKAAGPVIDKYFAEKEVQIKETPNTLKKFDFIEDLKLETPPQVQEIKQEKLTESDIECAQMQEFQVKPRKIKAKKCYSDNE